MSYVPPHLRNRDSGPPSSAGPQSDRNSGSGALSSRGGPPVSDRTGESTRFSHRGGRFSHGGGHPFEDRGGGSSRRFDAHSRSGGNGGGGAGGGGGAPRRPKGAPSRFGSIGKRMDGALRDGEDVPGGTRVDTEGMVYEMADGSVRYFQDRGRKYPFSAGPEALPLLRGLLATNNRVFAINKSIVDATGDAKATIRHGEALYADKPTMKAHHGALGTWSDEEYAHPGLQAVYLRLKSFQRFTESWALFERAARRGIFERYLTPLEPVPGGGGEQGTPALQTLHVASLGGGPGYELLAFEWFIEFWAAAGRKGNREAASAWLRSRRDLGHGDLKAGSATPGGSGPASGDGPGSVNDISHEDGTGGDTGGGGGGADDDGTGDGDLSTLASSIEGIDIGDATTLGPGGASSSSTHTTDVGRPPPTRLVSLDLQPTWEPYVLALPSARSSATYSFAQWNIKEAVDAVTRSSCPRLDVCLISNVLVYCTDEPTAEVLTALLTKHKVNAILVNERGAEQKMVEMLNRRGVVVVRLMDQSGGRDDRQLLLLPPGTPPPTEALAPSANSAPAPGTRASAELPVGDTSTTSVASQEMPLSMQDARVAAHDDPHGRFSMPPRAVRGGTDGLSRRSEGSVFPNVPYEERKYE